MARGIKRKRAERACASPLTAIAIAAAARSAE
jgi:hypothetical protein